MTGPQLATLQEVTRLGPTTVTALARRVHSSAGTVSGIVFRLERQGLIQRDRSLSDRRAVLLSATPEGRRVADAAPSLLQDRFREELERLDDWERLQMLSTLQRIAGLMGAERIETEPHLISDTVSLRYGGDATIDPDPLAARLGGDRTPPDDAPRPRVRHKAPRAPDRP